MLIQTVIDSIVQLIVLSIIPFIWWFFTARKVENFFIWIGLKPPKVEDKKKAILMGSFLLLIFLLPGMFLLFTFENKTLLASAKFAGSGFLGAISILFFSFIQTGLAEEIVFRGFLNKRLSNKFGFVIGNSIQAILFGLLHGALVFLSVSPITTVLLILFPTVVGWLMGYMNEKYSSGSIIPSWVIHGLTNVISSAVFLFGFIKV